MAGADQRGKVFYKTVHHLFLEKAPESSAGVKGRYGLSSAGSVQKHVNDHSADAQKLAKTHRSMYACKPTVVTEDQMLSMIVAVHVEKCETMSYDHKDFRPFNWIGFKAWVIWRNHPKCVSPTAHAAEDGGDALVGSGADDSALDGAVSSIENALALGAVE